VPVFLTKVKYQTVIAVPWRVLV